MNLTEKLGNDREVGSKEGIEIDKSLSLSCGEKQSIGLLA